MSYLLFANNTEIEAEGFNALNLSNLESDHVLFRVGGFKKQSIQVKDCRLEVIRYTRKMLLEGEPVGGFAPLFNTTAYLKIWLEENGRLLAEVLPPVSGPARFHLWITTACGVEFPRFRYRLFQRETQENRRNALFCIYHRPALASRPILPVREGYEVALPSAALAGAA